MDRVKPDSHWRRVLHAFASQHEPHRGVTAFSELATQSPAESIAQENEIVAQIAREPDYPEQPAHDTIEAQLRGLVDPDEIRKH